MVSFRACLWAAAALLSFGAVATPNPGNWTNPKDSVTFHIGQRQNITFSMPFKALNVALWQQYRTNNGATKGPVFYTSDNNPGFFEWSVELYDFNLTTSNRFFFWIFEGSDPVSQGNTDYIDSSSPYFYIAEAVTTTSSSSSSSATTSTSTSTSGSSSSSVPKSTSTSTSGSTSASNSASTSATSTPSSTAAASSSGGGLSSGASAGIGVGVALGVIAVAAIAGFIFWKKRSANKTPPPPPPQQQQHQHMPDTPGNDHKAYYSPVAETPATGTPATGTTAAATPMYQNSTYYSPSPAAPYKAGQVAQIHEAPANEATVPVEIG